MKNTNSIPAKKRGRIENSVPLFEPKVSQRPEDFNYENTSIASMNEQTGLTVTLPSTDSQTAALEKIGGIKLNTHDVTSAKEQR